MIISIEKAFGKIQYSFLRKTFSNLGIEGNFFNLMKSIFVKPTTDIILNVERFWSRTRPGYPLLLLIFNIVVEI